MANILGRHTIKKTQILEVDVNPNLNGGTDSQAGSLAIDLDTNSLWIKKDNDDKESWAYLKCEETLNLEVSNTQINLDKISPTVFFLTGDTDGLTINLGTCTQYFIGKKFEFMNSSSTIILIQSYNGSTFFRLSPYDTLEVICKDTTSETDSWVFSCKHELDKRLIFNQYTDFCTSTYAGETGWTSTTSYGAISKVAILDANSPGLLQFSTGTNSTGRSCLYQGTSNMFFGGGAVIWSGRFRFEDLSISTQEYIFDAGFGDQTTTSDHTDGVYFEYRRASGGNYWRCVTASNSTRTINTTTSNIIEDTWYNLRIEINATATQALFFVNNILINTITSNIPNSSTKVCSLNNRLRKSVGTTDRLVYLDYIDVFQYFSSKR